jgi:micrococcal nuclease
MRQRRGIAAMALIVLITLAAAQRILRPDRWPQSDRLRYDEKSFIVVKVVDGDTIDLDVPDLKTVKPHTRIRLWGLDTPETKHPQESVMYYGPEAAAFTEKLTLNQQVKVVLEPFQDTRDKYSRLLAYIYLPDCSMLNEQLISLGYAYADERFEHVLRDRFVDLQKQAQREKQGLWLNVQLHQFPEWYQRRHNSQ